MALVSPGVEVTITDQSQYLPAPTNSVPFVLLATAQNKANAAGDGVAAATTAANANKLYQVTSQRDLVNLYGKPFFYTTVNGTPIQGYELNEYGLLAAYSLLGVTNRCYVLRADIDLASLVGQTGRPSGFPDNGTYWLDTTNSTWGLFEWNATTEEFELQTPIVITDATYLSSGTPIPSLGNIGDYAVVATEITTVPTGNNKTFWHKTVYNAWVPVGSSLWFEDIPTVQGTQSNPTLTVGNTFTIGINGFYNTTITVPSSPNNNVAGIAGEINALGWENLSASVQSGKLTIFSNQPLGISKSDPSAALYITLTTGTGTVLADLGLTAGNHYQPMVTYGTSANMPLWSSSQLYPRPSGSLWIKVGAAGQGLNPVISEFNAATERWVNKTVNLATSDWAVTSTLDATGGAAIPAGTVYGQYEFNGVDINSPLYYFERIATGPTIITGSNTSPSFTSGPYYMNVYVSIPGSSVTSAPYPLSLADNSDATDFVTAWAGAAIPYTTATVNSDGAIVLTHTEGGVIILDDTVNASYSPIYQSNGLIAEAGFDVGTTTGVKTGPYAIADFLIAPQASTSGVGTGATFDVRVLDGYYYLIGSGVSGGGSGYAVGDTVTIAGNQIGGTTPSNDFTVVVTSVSGGAITNVAPGTGAPNDLYMVQLSNWVPLTYTANEGAPVAEPANNTNWFYSVVDQVDIMVNKAGAWVAYRNTAFDSTGAPAATGSNTTDPNGPIVSASEPTTQSDGTALSYGDIWIDTSDLENYPVIYRWQAVSGTNQWVLINNTDQVSSKGVLFADARWATNGTTSVTDDPIPTIVSLLTSNYLDLDAPSATLYPQGMLLFNTRRSGYNVKQFRTNYFNASSFPDETLPTETNAWVSVSGNQSNGAMYAGRKAQRAMVVQALRSAIDTNTAIRDEDNFFNLLATPNYPELQANMIVLNGDRGETGYIIGDTPLGLSDDATAIQNWATNAAGATSTGETGLVTRNSYMGLFYPSGYTTDLDGNEVAVPASHMMLRTFLRNDTIAYPWLAAAGTRRGTIDNALSIGYVDRTTGEFISIKTRLGIRDVLYINFINPLVFFTGIGLLNYGNKSSFNSQSALDRTNVGRLVAYVRRQLTIAARPFVFEPNDALTRNEISGVVETLMIDLVSKRGIYDYLVVCDESNNTPARIDRNELWIDVAIEPVKAAEFIYIPVRILNTGELSAA